MFQIHALDPAPFAPLFDLGDAELAARRARRVTATSNPGFPCRVSLEDAEIGEEALLFNFEHQGAHSPFRASHAIYVRRGAVQARPAPGGVPAMMTKRVMSLRAFDERHEIAAGELASGPDLAPALETLLAAPGVAYVHLHFAKYGCYAARATRIGA